MMCTAEAEPLHRQPARLGRLRIHRIEPERIPHHDQADEHDGADADEPPHVRVGDGHDLAREQAEAVRRSPLVEREEEDAEAEAERHEHSDDRVAISRPRAQEPDDQSRDDRAGEGSHDDGSAEQQRERCSRERELADPVHREGHIALHHEGSDEAADDAERDGRDERVAHQHEQLAVVGEREHVGPGDGGVDRHAHQKPSLSSSS
jgi:hypothetical protein